MAPGWPGHVVGHAGLSKSHAIVPLADKLHRQGYCLPLSAVSQGLEQCPPRLGHSANTLGRKEGEGKDEVFLTPALPFMLLPLPAVHTSALSAW